MVCGVVFWDFVGWLGGVLGYFLIGCFGKVGLLVGLGISGVEWGGSL